MEVWKDIDNYIGLYQVSNYGRVRGLMSGKILSPKVHCKTGYSEVTLYRNGIGKTYRLHRLVAFSFLPLDGTKSEINHIDGNKQNNAVENLEWCDRKYNTHYGNRIKLSKDDVRRIRLLREDGLSARELASSFNISISQVYKIVGYKQWR